VDGIQIITSPAVPRMLLNPSIEIFILELLFFFLKASFCFCFYFPICLVTLLTCDL